MKKACVFFSSVIVLLVLLSANSKAYIYHGTFDTSNGFCEEERYGRIPVGGVGYDDERCEEISCEMGCTMEQGRSGMPGCRLVRGEGHYPNCCEHEQCD
ncbi:SVWC domain-containing protein [Caerostris extrusa]|uniref:SVWC domain-containing protein n=1 Tax=Caerostris extrusa TaxID=172846 RepID=A0AAV4SF83_CAEEX|nr:SVWC domain-containing protein [Caerostris extrusa]